MDDVSENATKNKVESPMGRQQEKRFLKLLKTRSVSVFILLVVIGLLSVGAYFMFRNQGGVFSLFPKTGINTGGDQVLEDRYLDRNKTWERDIKAIVKELAEYHQQNGEYPNRIDIFADQLGIDAGELRVVYEYRVESDLQNYRLCVSLYGKDRLCYDREGKMAEK
jgi:hypothetical protein